MAKRTCSVDGCDRPHKAFGWCHPHYERWRRNGDVGASKPFRREGDEDRRCSVLECGRPVSARGLCKTHHARSLRFGDALADVPIKGRWPRNPDGRCSIEGCEREQRGRSWCSMHHGRWLRYGDVQADKPYQRGRGHVNLDGYRHIWRDGRKQLEHRAVMERMIGRPLLPSENVHHKNGIRLDNRPENLELWVCSQPSGQRVPDLLAWAHEIITRYGELSLLTHQGELAA